LLTDELSASISLNKNVDYKNINKEIERFQKRKNKGPTEEQRKKQFFDLIVKCEDEKGNKNSMILSGNDMYLVTAKVISYLVKQQLKSIRKFKGILSPYELLKGSETEFFEYVGVKEETELM
jgi:short subunit dehydrogenase-like uncharacterized protein